MSRLSPENRAQAIAEGAVVWFEFVWADGFRQNSLATFPQARELHSYFSHRFPGLAKFARVRSVETGRIVSLYGDMLKGVR